MWLGDTIYFSRIATPVTLFAYDVASNEVTKVLLNGGLDLKSASSGPGRIVYEQSAPCISSILLRARRVLSMSASWATCRGAAGLRKIETAGLSAAGSPHRRRAVFQARGEIVTVPEKGDIRNLTQTPGVADRYPAWSPDGKWIAYFSDESGEYALHLRDKAAWEKRARSISVSPSFFYTPLWSPDSKRIAYTDKRLNLCT